MLHCLSRIMLQGFIMMSIEYCNGSLAFELPVYQWGKNLLRKRWSSENPGCVRFRCSDSTDTMAWQKEGTQERETQETTAGSVKKGQKGRRKGGTCPTRLKASNTGQYSNCSRVQYCDHTYQSKGTQAFLG